MVYGAEFCEKAVKDFFTENKIEFEMEKFEKYEIYRGGNISIYRGDIFVLPITHKFDFVYDRAALVAIEPLSRQVSLDKKRFKK